MLKNGSSIESPPSGPFSGPARNFFNNRFVYLVISQRAHGLSIGVNLNPDKACNFKCPYCEIDRTVPARDQTVDIPVMVGELDVLVQSARRNLIAQLPGYNRLPPEWLELKEVALSGDGEPTLSPQFAEIVDAVVGYRTGRALKYFKIVLITNGSGLPLPGVRAALRQLKGEDEIWVKLDAGTQEYLDRVNAPGLKLSRIMANIMSVARERPVVIQSLFPKLHDEEPDDLEIQQYVRRLNDLLQAGAQIDRVQIYSAHRPSHLPDCSHLPLATLSRIARQVRLETGLRADVF